MTDKNIKVLPETLNALNLFKDLSDTIYIDKDQLYFIEEHIRGNIKLPQILLSKPSKIPSKGFVELLQKYKNPTLTINKNKLEVKEYRKSETTNVLNADLYEVDEDTLSNREIKKQNRFQYDTEIPSYDKLEDKDIDYQVVLDREKLERIKRWIELNKQPKGYFVKGNPNKTKIYFGKERRNTFVKVEDRNVGIFSNQLSIQPNSLKRKYQFVLSYAMINQIPDGDFKIQMSGNKFVSEWFSSKRKLTLSIDLLKISYAKN
jgi:hypothetical protein